MIKGLGHANNNQVIHHKRKSDSEKKDAKCHDHFEHSCNEHSENNFISGLGKRISAMGTGFVDGIGLGIIADVSLGGVPVLLGLGLGAVAGGPLGAVIGALAVPLVIAPFTAVAGFISPKFAKELHKG